MKPSISILRGVVARRILGLFILCALLPIGSLAVLSLWEMSGTLQREADQRMRQSNKNVGMSIFEGLYSLQVELEALALSADGPMRTFSGRPGYAVSPVRDRHFLGITLFRGESGNVPLFGKPCPLPPLADASRKHLASGRAMVFVQQVPGAPSRVYMVLASARRNRENGMLVGEIHPDHLREIVDNAIPAEGDFTVLDSNGGFLYRSGPLPQRVVERILDERQSTSAGQFEWKGSGDTLLVNFRSIFLRSNFHSDGWTVVVSQPKAKALAPVHTFTRMFVLILLLAFLVVSLLGIVHIRKTLSPLEKLRDGTSRVGQGDFDSRIDIRTGDEFEELALSFNAMSEHLGAQFRALTDANARMEREITEREQVEEKLRHAQKMEAVGILTGGIAHDFNNLLTAINGYSSILLHKVGPDDPIRKEIRGINDAGERAASLVRQLLTFSRKQVLELKVVNLNRVLSGIDRMLRRLIGENIEVSVNLAEGLWSVHADPGQIEQVVMNLAANARDAMQDGGKLTIETANREIDRMSGDLHPVGKPGKYVVLTVSDTGCGMDEKTRARVFEPFFTTKPPGKGTGLGLSTAYGIVKQSRGHILLESAAGKGTVFTVYLPRVESSSEEQQADERVSAEDGRGSETLLVAEDEDLVRDLVRSVLTEKGYEVLTAQDGEESLRIGQSHDGPIHLMLTDMVMPHMSGPEVAKRLAPVRPDMKILYMSGYAEDSGNGDEEGMGGEAFLQKPFRPEALVRKVRELLDG